MSLECVGMSSGAHTPQEHSRSTPLKPPQLRLLYGPHQAAIPAEGSERMRPEMSGK